MKKSLNRENPSSGFHEEQQEKNKSKDSTVGKEIDKGRSILFVSLVLFSGGVVLCIYSFSIGTGEFMTTLSISAMIAFTSSIVGAFIGFIFGIPRTPASKDPDNIAANTNLEEISDWITKIIVGVSLVQLSQIKTGIVALGNSLAQGLGEHPSSFIFSVSTMIFYFVGGFFLGYLWSRIYLPKILAASVKEGYLKKIENQLEETKTKLEKEKSRQELQTELKNEVDILVLQSDPKNSHKLNVDNFKKEKLQKLIDRIIENFDQKDISYLFGQIIISLYSLPDYNLINELAEQYKSKIDMSYGTWTDIALANLSLYNSNRINEYRKQMSEAIKNARKTISDYGVTYAIELYFDLIDLSHALEVKDGNLEKEMKEDIKVILNEIKSRSDVAAFETINYLNLNEGKPKWTEYNKQLRDLFAEDYNAIMVKSDKYNAVNPNINKYYGATS